MSKSGGQIAGIFMVSGTIIGAGMLALPLSSYQLGFLPSSIIMLAMFCVALFSSLNIAKINLYFNKSISIPLAARNVLGRKAEIVSIVSKLLLLYSLLSAYISGSVSILHEEALLYNYSIDKSVLSCTFALVFGLIIISKFKTIDYINRVGCFVMLLLFFLIAGSLITDVEIKNLKYVGNPTISNTSIATLLFFTSFGFQLSIHAITKYIGIEYTKVRRVFIIGTLIPLCIYIVWQIVSLGSISMSGGKSFESIASNSGNIGMFVQILSSKVKNIFFAPFIRWFTLLAILTSFLGVALGLLNYFMELFEYEDTFSNRLKAGLFTFVVPLLIVLVYPQIFIKALALAAAFLSLVSIIIPALISLTLIKRGNTKYFNSAAPIAILLFTGVLLVLLQSYQAFTSL